MVEVTPRTVGNDAFVSRCRRRTAAPRNDDGENLR
jgi:hypothetical protein